MIRILLAAGTAAVGVGVLLAPVAGAAPYANCSRAKADGACNIPQDSPYYQAKLDRDGDGVGCEC